jgi:GTP-binding protein HflX
MWTHLSRQGVGGVGLRGPGETQLEADRREAGKRIALIKNELGEVHRHRELYRERRRERQVPVVALVGYTNAGKSTLLNAMTGAEVLSEDKLFATLDPTTRRLELPAGGSALLTDTVGFINNLPTMVIAAFRATLEEINEAAVLVHVVDVTHPNAAEQAQTVDDVLEEIGADGKPGIIALNKVDLFDSDQRDETIAALREGFDPSCEVVAVSAVTREGLDSLRQAIERLLEMEQRFVPVTLTVPYDRSDLVDRFHRTGRVERSSFDDRGTTIVGTLPEARVGQFTPYIALRGTPQGAAPAATAAPESAA